MEDTLAPSRTTSAFTSNQRGPDRFVDRHLGPSAAEVVAMLEVVGYDSLEALIDATVPAALRTTEPMKLPAAASEAEALAELGELAAKNRVMRSMIGQGYHGTATPAVIRRAVLENPRWYTPYTPYQAEIAQGRLECLLTFQTLVSELTGLPLANASLLDEATAAAEAMAMCFAVGRQRRATFVVSAGCHPQTIAVCKTRAGSLGIELEVVADDALVDAVARAGDGLCGVLVQTPGTRGTVGDYAVLAEAVHAAGGMVVAAADPLALVLMDPPGAWGADVAVGSTQRFGVPMGMGGPHAAYMATHEKHARKMPGRIVGVSKDAAGRRALRLAIQTREQHIKRDKATSNICTAQALLAVVAQFYAVYHGPEGLRRIAEAVHGRALRLRATLDALGGDTLGGAIFDTVTLRHTDANRLLGLLERRGINARRLSATEVSFACDETTTDADLEAVAACVAEVLGQANGGLADAGVDALPRRAEAILEQPVFNSYHDEHSFLRYTNRLAGLDLSLADGMIPLGSCTMKLNAAAEMLPIHWPGFADVHPFAPADQLAGGHAMVEQLNDWLSAITGFAAVSMQPNAGSQGEYAGLMTIRAYHAARGEGYRDVCLIPESAHGTNPASAVIAGMRVVGVRCDERGDVDLADLREKAEANADKLAALMVTYPSTHGVFEAGIRDACAIVHEHGGQVYMDGANLNAQVGLTNPGAIGADVCHLNLHKTFCIPHGGGGPGMGPIGVAAHLADYLPASPLDDGPGDRSGAVSAAPFGSPMILPISWMYIRMMGADGLTRATQVAILNANYVAKRLSGHYEILYTGPTGTVAHEGILDCRPFDKAGVTVEDIAKRLIDFGFHAPTMSWPVARTLMVEPTESEPKAELDRFCDAMIAIREEIASVERGEVAAEASALRHAPHPAADVAGDAWERGYGREAAAYPVDGLREPGRKYWPPVARVDNPYGDRHLVCTCGSVEEAAAG
ncbi:MAG: aminomethyl-transferring glycine dehydrogenase [Planctomycetota bacterium]